jgi:eukaryotic-like serine/threonine-protein kinase
MQVDPKSWPILSRLMDEWLDLEPERRAEWLASLQQEHADILPALQELLSQPNPAFLANLPEVGEYTGGTHPVQALFAPDMAAGPYRLVRELGHGGMGVVWLAERADGSIKREVALKLPHFYLYSPAMADRFARERDILARLTDSRIARLYDAGVTAQGQPYLALEYVEGEAITVYCDRLRLDVKARLNLFLEVLRAVQYAHANLVVHRDLKPSNILVTNAGGVRLLDFGIAKLLEEGAAEETELTRFGGRALTPDFASPEQLAGGVISTASDVYSLGILLYELLTGGRPYRLSRDASGDLAERVLKTDALRPSHAAGEESKAAARGASVKRLRASLRGDLDTIVLKAIQKEPLDRYSTADAFAQDIERYLSGQPVLARPASGWYRAKKFVRRNRLAVSAAIAVLLAVGAGTGIALWQAHRADVEAATAKAVSDFLQNDLLSQASSESQANAQPGGGRRSDPDIKIRTALDRAAASISGKFGARPVVEGAIRETIGNTYLELSLYTEARQQLERALEIRRRVLGAQHLDTLKTMFELAETYRREGKYAQAQALLSDLVGIERRLHRETTPEAMAAEYTLASIIADWRADYPSAEALYTSVLTTQRRVLGETDRGTLATMNNLAALLVREGKYPPAEEQYRKLIEIKRRVLGPEHPSTLSSMNGLATLYYNEGKYAEAEDLFQTVLGARRRVMGEQHRDTLASMNSLGALYRAKGENAKAEELLTRAVETNRRVLGEDNPDTLSSLYNLAELYRKEGRLPQADSLFQHLLEARQRASGPESAPVRGALLSLGEIKLERRAYANAEPLLRKAVEGYRKANATTWSRYYAECLLGASLAGLGRRSEAEPLLTDGYQNLLQRRDSIAFEYRSVLDQIRRWVTPEHARP